MIELGKNMYSPLDIIFPEQKINKKRHKKIWRTETESKQRKNQKKKTKKKEKEETLELWSNKGIRNIILCSDNTPVKNVIKFLTVLNLNMEKNI